MKEIDIKIEKNKEEIIDIINKILDKGANYVIKSMPINSHIKDILIEVKKVIGEREFGQVLKVALSSSINEGLEIAKASKTELDQIKKLLDIAFDGGLTDAINAGIDIVGITQEYGNIFSNYIKDFFSKLKSFVSSIEFKKKMYSNIEKCLDKIDNFKELCNDWYDAYDNFNMSDIKNIANKLNKMKSKVLFNTDCINENTIIQNMTELVERRNKPLTKTQYDIFSNLYEI